MPSAVTTEPDFHAAQHDCVTERLHRHIDQSMQLLELGAMPLIDASNLMVGSLLADGRILTCGEGAAAPLAQYLATVLVNRLGRERPGLPAMNLGAEAGTLTAIAGDHGFNDIFARQLRALGQPRDILVLITANSGSGSALQAVQAAHDREMPVIALCSDICDDFRALLTAEDMELRLPTSRRDEFVELAVPVLHSLCDLIELQLFGSEESS